MNPSYLNLHPMKRAVASRLIVILLCLLTSSGLHAQWMDEAKGSLIIQGGWLFDEVSGERVSNPGIAIRDGKIVAIGPVAGADQNENSIKLAAAATILPGFIDLHAHYNYDLVDKGRAEEVKYTGLVALANGVTSTWSAGEYFPERVLQQRDRIDRGEAVGPRLFASGPYMGGFRCEYAVGTAEDDCIGWPNDITEAEIRSEVDYWASRGVISLKIKQANPEETRILLDQASKHGMTSAGHLSNYQWEYDVDPRRAIPMGLTRLEHNLTLGNGGPRSSELEEVIAMMLEHRVYFDANLQMYGGINFRSELPDMVWTDESEYFTPYAQELLRKRGSPEPESTPEEFAQRLVELRRFHDAGGADLLIIGTDEPVYTTLLPGFAYHRELMAMVHAGIPARDVLRAATVNGAEALGVSDRLGSISEGKLADLVIVDGNPLEDIKAARRVEWVIKNGEPHRPSELLDQAKGKIGPRGPNDHADWVLEVKPLRRTQH